MTEGCVNNHVWSSKSDHDASMSGGTGWDIQLTSALGHKGLGALLSAPQPSCTSLEARSALARISRTDNHHDLTLT